MHCVKQFFKSLLRFFVDLPVHSYQWRLLRSSLIFCSFKTEVVVSAAIVADQAFTTKNQSTMNCQYPEKGGYFCHKRRDIYGKLYKTLIFGFVKFNPWKFFLPGLVEFTITRLFVLVFLHCCGDVFLVWWRWSFVVFLALNFPKVEQTHRDLLEDWPTLFIITKNKRTFYIVQKR